MFYQHYRKFTLWTVIVLLFALILTACGNAATSESTGAESAPVATTAPVEESTASTAAVTTTTAVSDVTTAVTTTTVETSSASAAVEPSGAARTFTLTQDGTEARFSLYELLMGQDKTVVGATSLVEGSITVDPANPGSTAISPIRIDASAFKTDSDRRNGAIQRFILESNQAAYQYIRRYQE